MLSRKTPNKNLSGSLKAFHTEHLQPEHPSKLVAYSNLGHNLQLIIHLINFASFSASMQPASPYRRGTLPV